MLILAAFVARLRYEKAIWAQFQAFSKELVSAKKFLVSYGHSLLHILRYKNQPRPLLRPFFIKFFQIKKEKICLPCPLLVVHDTLKKINLNQDHDLSLI